MKNVQWKAEIPGYGWSQPIVVGDKVFVTTATTDNQQRPQVGGRGGGPGGPGGFRRGEDGPRPKGDAPRREGVPQGKGQPQGKSAPGNQAQSGPPGPGGPRGGRGGFGGSPPPNAVYSWKVFCLDRGTGKVLWEQLAHEGKPTIGTSRTRASASTAVSKAPEATTMRNSKAAPPR